jgi:PhzF family phenazine biosynthesis protein
MHVEVQIVNAFIDGATGGNPAGVVVDANALTAAQKLKVAQQVGLSETAFVSASDSSRRRDRLPTAGTPPLPLLLSCDNWASSVKATFPKKRLMATGTSS